MKRFSIIATLLCAFAISSFASKQPIAFKFVPDAVQKAVLENYTKEQIQFITSEKKFRNYEYEFILNDGTSIKYDKKAKFREVKNKNGIKEIHLPKNILQYIRHTFPNTVVTEYEKESYRQKVELNDKMELVFDIRGRFMYIAN
ncbi:MAG: PepSY-like domain-containing protein [Paludibacteraceae bacterium]|nr:PepSY-like domain-containing protein [Paludibacteraceae bacterium]